MQGLVIMEEILAVYLGFTFGDYTLISGSHSSIQKDTLVCRVNGNSSRV